MYDELIKALRCEQYGDDECENAECPFWSELGCRNGVANRDAADALERLMAQVPAWISVEERLPENEGRYLAIFYEEMIIDFGYYRPSVGWCEQGITHWMPLPKAPDLT